MHEKPGVARGPVPVPFLYHATRASNLGAILAEGLRVRHHGAVHGGMDLSPPKPAIYLSRKPASDNLHAGLFTEPVVVLRIDTSGLDPDEMWPDDFIYGLWAEGEILSSAAAVAKAAGVSRPEGERILEGLEATEDAMLPLALKPFWRWYLLHRKGGELAHTADIPPEAILGVRHYGAAQEDPALLVLQGDDMEPLP
ncbi:hypothetical protein LAZ40_05445 [Cereibacter sphaeroides]|uniref:hypothetical protein n=1 Tax=Cereibacter sphaeroides TaxID=1063 RepID=UPI001F3A95C7|nr:hypothetical protein [Cereibacter sphaeroides]MCE6958493.1 hypothetical protein [Cereibacter sphaeroides]MCE6972845.1 hypothetical protein [Cereibacter sphaeroides]